MRFVGSMKQQLQIRRSCLCVMEREDNHPGWRTTMQAKAMKGIYNGCEEEFESQVGRLNTARELRRGGQSISLSTSAA